MTDKLTPKQEAFCQRYLETGNASEAYRLSYNSEGMKPASISRKAFELLENVKITAYIDELKARQLKRHDITVDRVLAEYAKLAFLDIRKAFNEDGNLKSIHELDDDTAAAIAGIDVEVKKVFGESEEELEEQPHGGSLRRKSGVTVRLHKIKLTDKKGALDSLARHLSMFNDKLKVSVTKTHEELLEELADQDDPTRAGDTPPAA